MEMYFKAADLHQRHAYAGDEVRDGVYGDPIDITRAPRKTPVGIRGVRCEVRAFDLDGRFHQYRLGGLGIYLEAFTGEDEDTIIAALDGERDDEDAPVSDERETSDDFENLWDAVDTAQAVKGVVVEYRRSSQSCDLMDDPGDDMSKDARPSEAVVSETHDPATCDFNECREGALALLDYSDWFDGYDDGSPKRERIGPSNITGPSHQVRSYRLEPGLRWRRTRSGSTNMVTVYRVTDLFTGRKTTSEVKKSARGMGSFNFGQKPKYKGHRRALHDYRPLPKDRRNTAKSWITGRDIPLETPIH